MNIYKFTCDKYLVETFRNIYIPVKQNIFSRRLPYGISFALFYLVNPFIKKLNKSKLFIDIKYHKFQDSKISFNVILPFRKAI